MRVVVSASGVKNMLEGDNFDRNRVVDFFRLHFDGKVLSAYNLVMLLDVNYWEVHFLHDLSEL